MPELRKDPTTGRWMIIAVERATRPSDYKGVSVQEPPPDHCPFCMGNEEETPAEICAFRPEETEPDTSGWSVRVVPNKFPALRIEGELDRVGVGMYDMMNGVGAHEVIIETPHHEQDLAEMPQEQMELMLQMYRERITDLEKDPRFKYILVFKNYGRAAGASLSHPHSQLIATPVTPRNIKLELENAREYFLQKERCLFCDMLRQELMTGERLVLQNDAFVVYAPFASRFPFEMIVTPRRHAHDYKAISDEEIKLFASILRDLCGRMKGVLENPPYNFVLHTAPNLLPRPGRPDYWGTVQSDFHWHLEVIPRLTRIAGFEWGTGFYINTTSPEQAAKFLRERTHNGG